MGIDVNSVYRKSLEGMLVAERGSLARMRTHLDELGDHADYAAILRRHIATTTQQVDRLEKALAEIGGDAPPVPEDDESPSADGDRAIAPTAILGNLYAGFGFLHQQIAAYTSIEVIATSAGYAGHKAWIEQAIKEDRGAAEAVDRLIGAITKTFLARE